MLIVAVVVVKGKKFYICWFIILFRTGKSASDCTVFMADGLHICYKSKCFVFCFAWYKLLP